MPNGRLSLVTVSPEDQRRMRTNAISSQLLAPAASYHGPTATERLVLLRWALQFYAFTENDTAEYDINRENAKRQCPVLQLSSGPAELLSGPYCSYVN